MIDGTCGGLGGNEFYVIPMVCQVPKELRDPKIKSHLTNPEIAGSAILQWLLKGCLDWQRED
jgi:hypothetical protein